MSEIKTPDHHEWDDQSFVLPDEYILDERSGLADALKVFYSAGGYLFFNVIDPRYYASNWLVFMGDLYERIANGYAETNHKRYSIPLSDKQKQELVNRGVPSVFVTDVK